jgi:hypothetical protein
MSGIMDWRVQLLIAGAAIAVTSSLLTIVVQHILALRVDNILRQRTRQSRQAFGLAAAEDTKAFAGAPKMRIAHELGDLRIESRLNGEDSPSGRLVVVQGTAAVGQHVPLYEENWIKVQKYSRVELDFLEQMPAEYQAAIIYDGVDFAIYGTCPLHNVTVNDVPITAGYQRRTRLDDGDCLHFDTETVLRYEASPTIMFHLNS